MANMFALILAVATLVSGLSGALIVSSWHPHAGLKLLKLRLKRVVLLTIQR